MLQMTPLGSPFGSDLTNLISQGVGVAKDVASAVATGCSVIQPGGGTTKSVCDAANTANQVLNPPAPPPSGAFPAALTALDLQAGRFRSDPTASLPGVGQGTFPPGTLARFNVDSRMWSYYVPLQGFRGVFGQGESDEVEPPPPPGTTKSPITTTEQAPGTVNAGTEKKKTKWYKRPVVIGGIVVGTLVLVGGTWFLLRR